MSLPSPGPETLLGAKILIRDNYDNTLYTGLSEKILKRVREGRLDPEPIRLNGDGLLRTRVRDAWRAREENEGEDWGAVGSSAEGSVKAKAHD